MNDNLLILLSRTNVKELLTIGEGISAVENAFKLYGMGKATPPGILGMHADAGGFHIKAGLMNLANHYFVAKTNANFPENRKNFNLPTIQGVVLVMDAKNGRPLSIMDSIELTIIRTGAATAVAAKYLSKPDSKIVTICGCGEQGKISIRMLREIRDIQKVYAYDTNHQTAEIFAKDVRDTLSIDVELTDSIEKVIPLSDICVTCTTSEKAFVKEAYIYPGLFLAAVGADNEEKQELEPEVLKKSKLVTDLTAQASKIGELHHAIEAGLVDEDFVYAELGEIVAGTKQGRKSPDEIFVFDSTGMALQDVASAVIVYEKALSLRKGISFDFSK
ncbi:MAG TPA: ornithine cyclodeaminase family protein [Cyclobacteriaceae bacterium]